MTTWGSWHLQWDTWYNTLLYIFPLTSNTPFLVVNWDQHRCRYSGEVKQRFHFLSLATPIEPLVRWNCVAFSLRFTQPWAVSRWDRWDRRAPSSDSCPPTPSHPIPSHPILLLALFPLAECRVLQSLPPSRCPSIPTDQITAASQSNWPRIGFPSHCSPAPV